MTTQATTAEAGIPDEPAPDARLMSHAYDGIREYDNPLPGWWSAIFWATIVFAAGYGVFYHIGRWGKTPQQKYEAALASDTASYGTFSIAIASTRDWMSLHAMSFSSKCG